MRLEDLDTPALILDRGKLARNIERMKSHIEGLGSKLRPHIKTAKSREVARMIFDGGTGPLTVSTLREAEYFFEDGFTDILYAVGMAPHRLERAKRLIEAGCDLKLITDNAAVAGSIAAAGEQAGITFPTLIEIDSDDHRAGLRPGDPMIELVGQILENSEGASCPGVMTHAGASYNETAAHGMRAMAITERAAVLEAADALRRAGIAAPVVSLGSTPTATFTECLDGVSEVRAGCFVFHDMTQVGLGTATLDDVAITVLTRVIGEHRDPDHVLTDAGGLALSKDAGLQGTVHDCGFGQVLDGVTSALLNGVHVTDVNQEHGMLATSDGNISFADFPPDRLLRILPNHACMTAAAYERYFVVDGGDEVIDTWERCNGW